MPSFKHKMMMILLELIIANLPMRFGHIWLLLMKQHHKLRELKKISYVFSMRIYLTVEYDGNDVVK